MTWAALVVVLLLAGCVFLAVELLVLPGFGLMGVFGAANLIGATALAFVQLGPSWGLAALGAGVAVSAIAFWLFPRTSAGRALVLTQAVRGAHAADPSLGALVGATGRALTPLRPAGTAAIENRTVDVVTDGQFVDAGTDVRVVQVEGARVVVEPVRDA